MKWPKINWSLPKFFQRKTGEVKASSFYKIWRRFVTQIPREFRSLIKQHQHFLVLGDEKSGKTELIHGIVEQSQNIYPFEVEYNKDLNIQFYLGPKQVAQELSIEVVKDRTIAVRRSLIHLWKKLYAKNPPIVVITFHCWSALSTEIREIGKAASTISGKLSLLSEITKKTIPVRIALTHVDKIEGYLEFTNFLKQHNISFEIPLETNFESFVLESVINAFKEKYVSLILISVPANDFVKILRFFEELPKFFKGMEEYLRALTTGSGEGQFELEKLTFATKIEPFTALSAFDWTAPESNSIFFRHPMLKHQIAGAAIFIGCSGLILNNFFKDHRQVKLTEKGVDSLVYLKPKEFVEEVIPQIEHLTTHRPTEGYVPLLPQFFKRELGETNQQLAMRIRKHILEPSLRKLVLQDRQEIPTLYMLGLLYATNENRLGIHIIKHLHDWSSVLNLDEKLIRSYIRSNEDNNSNKIEIEHLDKINTVVPLTSPKPWLEFLTMFQDIVNQPVFTGHNFDMLRQEANTLLNEYRRIKNDPHGFTICNVLREVEPRMLGCFARNINTLGWLEQNSDLIESFLVFVCQSCPAIPDVSNHNVSQFFAKIRDIADLNQQEDRTYNFLLGDEKFSFHTAKWVQLSVAHVIERLIQSYIVNNHDTQGDIFFKNTPPIAELIFESYRNEFPHFDQPVVIPGRYTRLAFEKNVRFTTESLFKLLENVPLNLEDKERFTRFVQGEVASYAKQYQLQYEKVYSACNIKTSNLEEVKAILAKIAEPSSAFFHFLDQVKFHTEVFSNPPACLSALEEMNHFDFLRSLMSQLKNKNSPFEKYQQLIKHVHLLLSAPLETKNYADVVNLESALSPTARIALSMLRGDEDSFMNQVVEDLSQIGVPQNYHHLFTAPIQQVYLLGIKDLKRGIDRVWSETLQPQINRLLEKRPFNDESAFVATFEEVKKTTCPTSEVWSVLKQIVVPSSLPIDNQWIPKPGCDLKLDPAFYHAVNRLAKISSVLWDNEGHPQPIKLNVQSLPFETVEKGEPLPILSYLVTGEETFHNFNQNPSWHQITIEWWKDNSSTVVVELASKNESRSYRDEKVLNMPWSFFELLKKAASKGNNVWEWELGNQLGEKTSHVALKFEDNPWSLFQLEPSH